MFKWIEMLDIDIDLIIYLDICANSIYFMYFYPIQEYNYVTNFPRIIISYCFEMNN